MFEANEVLQNFTVLLFMCDNCLFYSFKGSLASAIC